VELSNSPSESPEPRGPAREPAPFIPRPPGRDRDGSGVLERKAVYRVQLEIAAMPASLVVQVLLWPEKLTDWAREEGVTPALVYNMLGGFKPYHDLRHRLAERLGVAKGALDHLIDGRRPQPTARRLPDPPDELQQAPPRPPELEHAKPVTHADDASAGVGDQPSDEQSSSARDSQMGLDI
jgi:hypothetical protein